MRVLVLVTVLLFGLPTTAFGCSCGPAPTSRSEHVRLEFERADAVFSAFVHEIHSQDIDGRPTRMARLRVLQVWKGDLEPDTWIDVISDRDAGLMSCGREARVDDALMVYAHGVRRPYALATCSLTGSLDGATIDISLLNKLSRRASGK